MRADIAANIYTVEDVMSAEEFQNLIQRDVRTGFECARICPKSGPPFMTIVRKTDRAVFDTFRVY